MEEILDSRYGQSNICRPYSRLNQSHWRLDDYVICKKCDCYPWLAHKKWRDPSASPEKQLPNLLACHPWALPGHQTVCNLSKRTKWMRAQRPIICSPHICPYRLSSWCTHLGSCHLTTNLLTNCANQTYVCRRLQYKYISYRGSRSVRQSSPPINSCCYALCPLRLGYRSTHLSSLCRNKVCHGSSCHISKPLLYFTGGTIR